MDSVRIEAIAESITALQSNTNVQHQTTPTLTNDAELFGVLEEYVTFLLTKYPEQLFQWLYKIDVSESKVNTVMKTSPVGAIATHLSELIVERTQQKILSRKKYKEDMNNSLNDY